MQQEPYLTMRNKRNPLPDALGSRSNFIALITINGCKDADKRKKLPKEGERRQQAGSGSNTGSPLTSSKVGKDFSELRQCKSQVYSELHSLGLNALAHHLASQSAQPTRSTQDGVIKSGQSKHCQALCHHMKVFTPDQLPNTGHGMPRGSRASLIAGQCGIHHKAGRSSRLATRPSSRPSTQDVWA